MSGGGCVLADWGGEAARRTAQDTGVAGAAALGLSGGSYAGILSEASLTEMVLAQWQETDDLDPTGTFLGRRAVVPHVITWELRRTTNIGCQLGINCGCGRRHYSAVKAAVIGPTKALAPEIAEHSVLVNVIAPGPVHASMVEGITKEWKRADQAEPPLARFGLPAKVAPTAVLFASDPGVSLYVGQIPRPNSANVMP